MLCYIPDQGICFLVVALRSVFRPHRLCWHLIKIFVVEEGRKLEEIQNNEREQNFLGGASGWNLLKGIHSPSVCLLPLALPH